jgi:hypothetical protein
MTISEDKQFKDQIFYILPSARRICQQNFRSYWQVSAEEVKVVWKNFALNGIFHQIDR